MALLSFSEPAHVPLILDGRKRQTTRQERKNPIKVGDILQVYYKSRCLKSCGNCINPECPYAVQGDLECDYVKTGLKRFTCDQHTNFFGTARVTSVETIYPDQMTDEAREAWAKADGFDSWTKAALWFGAKYGKKFENWRVVPWVVIKFAPAWLKEGSA